ncbi:phosphate ABC transporter, permease protein PstA [Candidatus Endobugula sertula]|uniref:Phosphate transport system permease protein PstA n=1 Tax=Candidatus Endobugula sertula TaxID=62101 RepID=A0A1D2QR72_9GAMM|nr:phosphate ABC transporter, permease protein PstA [Candidatus Endobugula sertula]
MTNQTIKTIDRVNLTLKTRHRAEKRFRLYGMVSIAFGLLCLLFLFSNIIGKGMRGFTYHYLILSVELDASVLGITDPNDLDQILAANYSGLIKKAAYRYFQVNERKAKKKVRKLLAIDGTGYLLQNKLKQGNVSELLGTKVTILALVDDKVDYYLKRLGEPDEPGKQAFDDQQLRWIDTAKEAGDLKHKINWAFFSTGDSSHSEEAGIRGAVMGSFYLLLVTFLLSFPIGIAAAIYLEEYAPTNRWTDLIEVNINNLAAVPSIIFGLLGLAIFLSFFGFPRSTPLVGGFVLTLMTLPTIIISSRAAIKAVPPSIRQAAYGIGASKMQVTLHHVLPLAMPGMLTGTIIGLAQALGESAPLLMIGMAAFIPEVPNGVSDPATALPMQIFQWFRNADAGFNEKASAAILVLLMFLISMNILAVWARRRLERRW